MGNPCCIQSPVGNGNPHISLTWPVSIKIRDWPLPTRYVLVPCSCMSPGFPPSIRTTSSLMFVTAGRRGSPAFRADRYSCHPDWAHTGVSGIFLVCQIWLYAMKHSEGCGQTPGPPWKCGVLCDVSSSLGSGLSATWCCPVCFITYTL